MKDSNVIKDGALLVIVYIVLLVLSLFIPVLIMPGVLIMPIPFIMFSSKYDWKQSLGMLLAALILSMFLIIEVSLPLTMLVGLGGIMIGTAMYQNLSAYETWARGSLGFVAGLLFIFIFMQFAMQINIATELNLLLQESLQTSKDVLEQFGLGGQAEEQVEIMEEQILLLTHLIPAGIAIVAIALSFLSQWIGYKVINRFNDQKYSFPPIRKLRFPTLLIWIYFFALIFTFVDLEPNSILYLVVHNVLTLIGVLIAIQGLSFVFFYAHHKKWRKTLPIITLILTLLLPFLLLNLIRIVGIIDIGFGLRDRLINADAKK